MPHPVLLYFWRSKPVNATLVKATFFICYFLLFPWMKIEK